MIHNFKFFFLISIKISIKPCIRYLKTQSVFYHLDFHNYYAAEKTFYVVMSIDKKFLLSLKIEVRCSATKHECVEKK